jgi:FRG domain
MDCLCQKKNPMEVVSPEVYGGGRPLDEILKEFEEIANTDFHRIREDTRDVWLQMAELSKKRWRSMFAFRGQAKMYQLKVRWSGKINHWPSVYASGYRFVHNLDWTAQWWSDPDGYTPPEVQALYDNVDARVRQFADDRTRWYFHLASHRLSKELLQKLTDTDMRSFREDSRMQELFKPTVTPEENLEFQRGLAKGLAWTLAFVGSLGQHYGRPSEYLDLTFSPKVATWFALQENWQRVLAGERVLGFLMSFNLPCLQLEIVKFKEKWACPYPIIIDISWIPTTIAKRPAIQQGLSMSNSPSPFYGLHKD